MPRSPRPWFRSERDAWYVCLDGRQVLLARGRESRREAEEEFHRLMLARHRPESVASDPGLTVGEVCDLRYGFLLRERAARTALDAERILTPFARRYGRMPLSRLRPYHLIEWCDLHPRWRQTARRNVLAVIRAAVGHAVRLGYLERSPLTGLILPPPARRQTCTGQADLELILPWVRSLEYREFLTVQHATACRPGELARLEASHLRHDVRAAVLEGKTTRSTGRARVIWFPDRIWPSIVARAERRPVGPLFRTATGRPWSDSARNCQHRAIRARAAKAGVSLPAFCSYALRHGAITDRLAAGHHVADVAAIAGHVSPTQVERVYSHLAEQAERMRLVVG